MLGSGRRRLATRGAAVRCKVRVLLAGGLLLAILLLPGNDLSVFAAASGRRVEPLHREAEVSQGRPGPMASNRLLHAMLHVRDVNETLNFCKQCGMQVLSYSRRANGAAGAFTGFGDYADGEFFALELSAKAPTKPGKPAPEPIDLGDGFQHFGIAAASSGLTANASSPDGYFVRPVSSSDAPSSDPFREVVLRVSDLEASTNFYTQVLGMVEDPVLESGAQCERRVLRFTAGGGSGRPTALVLVAGGPPEISLGQGFDHLAVSTQDVALAAKAVEDAGADLVLPPTVMFGVNITGTKDPDGYAIYLVDEADFVKSRPG